MKHSIFLLSMVLTFSLLMSCVEEYEAPPLKEPTYTGAAANITIEKLKSLYEKITDPMLIDVDYIIKAVVTANDISGNIYKQIYIEDETGGINMGVDQNSIFTDYRVGQELYVHLKGLYMVMYGEQLQIGYDKTQANRIPWEMFNFYTFKNKWPIAENAVPKTISLGSLNQSMVNTLVKLENVYFPDGGKLSYSESDATTNRTLKDGNGNSILVRNSNYASFAADLLPEGGGTVIGILSKFRSDWQLYLRSIDDIQNFGQPIPGVTPEEPNTDITTYYHETFGTLEISSPWPKVADYTGYDNKNVVYSDPSGNTDLRKTGSAFTTPHLWFPTKSDTSFKIEGIDTSTGTNEKLALSYELVANVYNAGDIMNLNAMTVKVDGVEKPVPAKELNGTDDKNKVYTITLTDIPAKKGLNIEFLCKMDLNKFGMRMDNIYITTAPEEVIVVKPKN